MIKAIVYTSQTGTTAEYAKLLGEQTNLPIYTLEEAKAKLEKGAEIIYMGWVMASTVKGYKDAKKLFQVEALCGVGMSMTGQQIDVIRTAENLTKDLPLFTLQGGFYLEKLKGFKKLIMSGIKKSTIKRLSDKPDRNAEEEDMLDLMTNGGSRVSLENLKDVIAWYQERKSAN